MCAALTAARSGCSSLRAVLPRPRSFEGLPGILSGQCVIQVATLKATYGEKYPYPEPFPYWKKKYNMLAQCTDKTLPRFNENTKVLVVEGNVAVGKNEFAKHLAKEFDLKLIPPTPDWKIFTNNPYNFDQRKLDPMLPEGAKSYDLKRFLNEKHPEKGTVGRLLLEWYKIKLFDYCDALLHVLSTGQGVVMVRSVFSDIVYVEAMKRMGYVTAPFMHHYANVMRANTICELLKPHMTIYLDAPVSVIRQRINARNNPDEVNSKVLSDAYLQAIADGYRDKFLPQMKRSGEVVEIDWAEKGTDMDIDVIAEELQPYSLDPESSEDHKYEDWTRKIEDEWTKDRLLYSNREKQLALFTMNIPWECPEVFFKQDDAEAYNKLTSMHPAFKYQPGWAPELGHSTTFKL